LLAFNPAKSCLNVYGQDIHGNDHFIEHRMFRTTLFNEKEIKKSIDLLFIKISGGQYTYKDISDYGVGMLRAGKYAEGLQLFRELVKAHAQEYVIIQNLGTAFELNGMPDSAFFYIRKGYLLNPQSHNSSEWLHISYLENLLSKTDIRYSKTIFLDTAVFRRIRNDAQQDAQAHEFKLTQFFGNVNYQLEERIPFTLGKDDLLAKLLTETGDLYAEYLSISRAHICYLFARYFNSLPEGETALNEKIRNMESRIKNPRKYGYEYSEGLKNFRLLSNRKLINTEKWNMIPVSELITRLQQAPKT
jgi:hypothetical protein